MIKKVINKSDIKKILRDANQDWNTYVPMNHLGGDVLYSQLSKDEKDLERDLERVNLNYDETVNSPKEIFFPQYDEMMEFNEKGEIKETVDRSKKLIFGVKPCDYKAIKTQDFFFERNYKDIYYLSRREKNLIIIIGCNKPPRPDACFCTSIGTGPFLVSDFDIQLIDMGDYYLAEIESEIGMEFVKKHSKYFWEPYKDEIRHSEEVKLDAEDNVKLKLNVNRAVQQCKGKDIPMDILERIADRCISCGACVYVCPKCTCFNVFDDIKDGEGSRNRVWDACVFAGYTQEASGHNPGGKKWYRTARRYEHALKYDCRGTGAIGCVGCGRCLDSCPVNIGMSKFIQEITTNIKSF